MGERAGAALILLRTLGAVLRTGLLAVLHALRVEHAAQHVVAHAGKVAHAAAADQHDRVLLKVVAFAGDVADDFAAVGQANLGHLAKRRVRLLRRGGVHAGADAALLRVLLHRGNLGLGLLRLATLADQLVDRRHCISFLDRRVSSPGCALPRANADGFGLKLVFRTGECPVRGSPHPGVKVVPTFTDEVPR